jgi:NAD(P)-dependent dehydrogenase (short-subunit alcohol dehydrogenase family)
MNELTNKVAVVTGAASGIGRSLALRAAAEGMGVVVADIEAAPLAAVEQELRRLGAPALAVVTDVSQATQVEALAQATMERFGRVDLLINNAGVGAGSTIWESSIEDWAWVLGINLWGVIHGLRSFVPLMLAQGTEGHIVNTASMAGLVSFHPSAPYHVSKHAVVALAEQLMISLKLQRAPIRVSVLCPGMVRTRILEAERNRPGRTGGTAATNAARDTLLGRSANPKLAAMMAQALAAEITAEEVAEQTFAAIRSGEFYILTHPELTQPIRDRATAILQAAPAQ